MNETNPSARPSRSSQPYKLTQPRPKKPSEKHQGAPSDAVTTPWLDRWLPAAWWPYARLSRLDRPIGMWLLVLPTWWGMLWGLLYLTFLDGYRFHNFELYHVWLIIAAFIGAVVMRGAGCTWNDIVDCDIDAKVERTRYRPLPSGQVTLKQALIWMAIQILLGGLILISFGFHSVTLCLLSLALIALYPFAKRFIWWPQLVLGLTFNFGLLVGGSAILRQWPPFELYLLYGACVMWTLFYDTIYASQDKKDDIKAGVKSTARWFGQNIKLWLFSFVLSAVGLIIVTHTGFALKTVANLGIGWKTIILMCALTFAALGFLGHLMWQLIRFDETDIKQCLRLFRSNRNVGFIYLVPLSVVLLFVIW